MRMKIILGLLLDEVAVYTTVRDNISQGTSRHVYGVDVNIRDLHTAFEAEYNSLLSSYSINI